MMALGIILEAHEAETILERGQADLIAVGRQSQYNPNVARHWRTNSALIVASRIGHQNTVGRLRSGSASLRHGVISPASHCRSRLLVQAGDFAVFIFQPLPLRHQ